MTTSTDTKTAERTNKDATAALDPEQRARVAALRVANSVLAATGFASRGAVEPIDLVNVAQYIVTGDDPWEASITRITDSAAETAATALSDALGSHQTTVHIDNHGDEQ